MNSVYECLEDVGGEDLCNGDESLFSKEQSGHTAELEQEEDEDDIEKICKGKSGIQKCLKCEEYVPLECLKTNHYFCCEAYARKAISDFCDKYFHPFQIKVRRDDDFPLKKANRIRPYWGYLSRMSHNQT